MPLAFWIVCAVIPLSVVSSVLVARVIVGAGWGKLSRVFPAPPRVEPSHAKAMQSCTVGGWCNASGCLTIVVDEEHLHVVPIRLARWFGVTPVSIPWEAIEGVEPLRRRGWSRARVAGTTLDVPEWCLEPAAAELRRGE